MTIWFRCTVTVRACAWSSTRTVVSVASTTLPLYPLYTPALTLIVVPTSELSRLPTGPPPNRPARGASCICIGCWRAAGERSSAAPGDCGAAANPPALLASFPPSLLLEPSTRQLRALTATMPPKSATSPRTFPHSVPRLMCFTVSRIPFPGPSTILTIDPFSIVSIPASEAVTLLSMSFRRMSWSLTGRTSGRSAVLLAIITIAASFSTLTIIPTAEDSSWTRSWIVKTPMLSTLLVTSLLSARSCENTRNSSCLTSENTVVTCPSTFTTRPDSPSCTPCTHRTCDPTLKYFLNVCLSTSMSSWMSSCVGVIFTEPSALSCTTTPVRLTRSPSTQMT
eukprot:31144-Pelagococcus_subviridis.AAC.1